MGLFTETPESVMKKLRRTEKELTQALKKQERISRERFKITQAEKQDKAERLRMAGEQVRACQMRIETLRGKLEGM